MKNIAMILAGAALALAGTSAATAKQTLAEKGEARLAKMLEGRVAGEPVNCVNPIRSEQLQVIEHVGVVYNAGKTVYVARPTDPRSLSPHDVVVFNRFGSHLCTNDIIRTVDRYNGNITGAVFLNDFVPYTKAG